MYRQLIEVCLIVATAAILSPGAAHGLIVVTPKPGQIVPHDPVQLVAQTVEVTLTDRAAEVEVECTYYNSMNTILEGTWIFPLPPEAAVDKFSMFVGGEEVRAELLDGATARGIYEELVRQTKDPAILEYIDRQVLRARVFPIEPLKDAKIKLYYTHPLAADFGTTDFVFPIAAETWSPQGIDTADTRLEITLETTAPLRAVTSPTHDVDIDRDGDHSATVTGDAAVLRQPGDFHLLCTYDTRDISAQFLTSRNDEGSFFMAVISPGEQTEWEALPKDVVFCFDRSGSMQGEKIEQARDALKFCLNSLNDEDRFGLVLFSDAVEPLFPMLENATPESIRRALRRVDAMTAEGGTYIEAALATSLVMFQESDRPKYLVFLTDGLPTVGARDPLTILNQARLHNEQDARIFTFGVGLDLNAGLLNELADSGRGFSSYVSPGDDVEIAVSNFYRKIDRPVLADARLQFSGPIEVADVYPTDIGDVFAGTEILVLGRFTGSGEATIRLLGQRAGADLNHTFTSTFKPRDGKYPFVPTLWAGRRIGHLLDDMRKHGETVEVRDEVVRLSRKYGVLTPYTAFLSVPEQPGIAMDQLMSEPQRSGDRPVNLQLGAFDQQPPSSRAAAGPDADDLKVHRDVASSNLRTFSSVSEGQVLGKELERNEKPLQGALEHAGGRTFLYRNDGWADVAQVGASVTDTLVIRPYSEAYFRLTTNSQIAEILSVGDKIMFVWRNVLIKIDEKGVEKWNNEWSHLL